MQQPRILPIDEPTPEQAEVLEPVANMLTQSDRPLNIFRTMARHPKLFKRFMVMGNGLLLKGTLPAREREIVILRVGWRCQSVYEFGQHTLIGGAVGLTGDEIERCTDASLDGWSDDDAVLVRLADDLCATDTVSDETWAGLAARWDDAQLMELVLVAGFYRMVSGFLNAVGVELDPGVPSWPST